MTKRIDVPAVPVVKGSRYPSPYHEPCAERARQRLGDAAGLTDFGVNLLRLPPGAWSSQRHWHTEADELVYVLAGEVTLVTDEGPELLRAGEAAGFKGADANGHCLRNLSDSDALVLEIGSRIKSDAAHYPDVDLFSPPAGGAIYEHKDGTPYEDLQRRAAKR